MMVSRHSWRVARREIALAALVLLAAACTSGGGTAVSTSRATTTSAAPPAPSTTGTPTSTTVVAPATTAPSGVAAVLDRSLSLPELGGEPGDDCAAASSTLPPGLKGPMVYFATYDGAPTVGLGAGDPYMLCLEGFSAGAPIDIDVSAQGHAADSGKPVDVHVHTRLSPQAGDATHLLVSGCVGNIEAKGSCSVPRPPSFVFGADATAPVYVTPRADEDTSSRGVLLQTDSWRLLPANIDVLVSAGMVRVDATQGRLHVASFAQVEVASGHWTYWLDGSDASAARLVLSGFRYGDEVPIGVYAPADDTTVQYEVVAQLGTVKIKSVAGVAVVIVDPSRLAPYATGLYVLSVPQLDDRPGDRPALKDGALAGSNSWSL
jgi:hypothetical protein